MQTVDYLTLFELSCIKFRYRRKQERASRRQPGDLCDPHKAAAALFVFLPVLNNPCAKLAAARLPARSLGGGEPRMLACGPLTIF